jgi:hypothetical protein
MTFFEQVKFTIHLRKLNIAEENPSVTLFLMNLSHGYGMPRRVLLMMM